MTRDNFPRLSFEGYKFLFALNDALDGEEVTSDGLADALDEAIERVGGGCAGCGSQVDTRFGWCYQCVMAVEED